MTRAQVEALHRQAREITDAADLFAEMTSHEELEAYVDRAIRARESLESSILAGLEAKVVPAAAGGNRHAIVYEFKGGQVHDDFSTLFLLLGGDDRERREELRAHGFEPMITTLPRKVQPFRLLHKWDKETNANLMMVTW